jgi:hypothetical protein
LCIVFPPLPSDCPHHRSASAQGFHSLTTKNSLHATPNYHKHTDTVDTLDFQAMASITENLVSAIKKLSV